MNMKCIHRYEGRFTFFILLISSLCCLLPLALASSDEVEDETTFAYTEGSGRGPKEWGQLDPHWKLCDTGKLQSPIDLLSAKRQVLPSLGKLKKDYKPAPAVVKNRGHDIMVRWKGDAGDLSINGTDYKLLQCHWHSPSEHTFNGTRYQLELHLVHVNAREELAVIAIIYKYGRPDPFLTSLLPHIKTMGDEEKNLGIVNPGNIKFGSRKYFRYIGSLTVPPCTEGVVWTVINKLRTVSRDQVKALRDAVHDGFEENVRPTQSWDGNTVLFYTPTVNSGSS
ncbi:A. THALIANA ALPHA CARBONIC ANHYDRASE 4, alpha carbonic anhydrase 4 [Hibiscus trionum]|uniref:A. THALIANA ALPHA CARBONIC ANHYDRASE 4, alpha carbonic anhydrase 4 n=2 Tax=Hibiscus trionum TaxID=183268 RepID=A0A9W7GSC1_HIBTR|nr:A. THALIANA ALPHA CARBONIC ANHYDRASE 4, alpha carbonic anhydrase 4 [Hibiscus trionum]